MSSGITDIQDYLTNNHWRNTGEAIEWFLKIPDKHRHKFAIFKIKDFYPSISGKLLTNALNFAKEITNISREDMEIMYHTRKSLSFSNRKTLNEKRRTS